MVESKYVESDSLQDSRSLELNTRPNPSVLGLAAYQTHICLNSAYGQAQISWVW